MRTNHALAKFDGMVLRILYDDDDNDDDDLSGCIVRKNCL